MKRKILVFSTAYLPLVGGAEVAIAKISEHLKEKYEFELITARLKSELPKREKVGNVVVHRIGFGNSFDKLLVPFLGAVKALKIRADIYWAVQATYASGAAYIANILAVLLPRVKRVPVVLTLQEGDSEAHLTRRHFGLIHLSWKLALKRSKVVTAISSYLSERAVRLGYRREPILIPNGIDVTHFQSGTDEDRKKVRNELGYKDSDTVLVTTSRLVTKNAVDVIIKSLKHLRDDVKLLVIGDGPLHKQLAALAVKEGLSARVLFIGERSNEDLPHYMAGADIFVRPSRSEGLGISFIEAQAAGLPVVSTRVGGIPDVVTHGETGLFASVNDPESLASQVQTLLDDDELKNKIVQGAREKASSYDWRDLAKQYEEKVFSAIGEPTVLIATPLYPPDIGGPATYTKLLEDNLPARGVNVEVVKFSDVKKYPYVIRHIVFFFKVLFATRGVDIVYAQDPLGVGMPTVLAAKIAGKKSMIRIVGDRAWETGTQKFGVSEPLETFATKKFYSPIVFILKVGQWLPTWACDTVVTASNYMRAVIASWGVSEDKIEVVYNAFTPHSISQNKEALKEELDLRGHVIVSVGRLVPWKGFTKVIESMLRLSDQFGDVKLFVIGEGPMSGKLKERVAELGLSDRVVFTGRLPQIEMLKYVKAADLFVLNTFYEGMSHVLLEAMSVGTPIVTTNVCGNPETVSDGEEGILIEYDNYQQLTESMAKVLSDSALRERYSKAAKEKSNMFTKDILIKNTEILLREQLK